MLYFSATSSAVRPIPQYQSEWFLATSTFGVTVQPPKGIGLMLSTPPAIMQSAIPELIFAAAMAMVSKPEEQYLFTVIPGTFTVSNPISEIILPMFNPSSASGVAQPAITSSIVSLSRFGTESTKCLITSAAISSGRMNLNTPLGAFPTADLKPATMYASIFT